MKKKILYSILFAILAAVSFNACKKDDNALSGISEQTYPATTIGLRGGDCYRELDKNCDLLVFDDVQEFQTVYECLKTEYENHIRTFDSLHSHLNDSLYNLLIDSIGWRESEPLEDFENAASHNSYRKKLQLAEDAWLAGGMSGINPWFKSGVPDPILATLMSSTQAYIIGTTLYYYDNYGQIYMLAGASCTEFTDLVADPVAALANNTNVSIWNPNPPGSCLWNGQQYVDGLYWEPGNPGHQPYTPSNYKYGWLQWYSCQPYGTHILGQMVSYKKKFLSSNWKRYRTNMYIKNFGEFYDLDCNYFSSYSFPRSTRGSFWCTQDHEWGVLYFYKTLEPQTDYLLGSQVSFNKKLP